MDIFELEKIFLSIARFNQTIELALSISLCDRVALVV